MSDNERDLFIAPHFIEQEKEEIGCSEKERIDNLSRDPANWMLRNYPQFQRFIDLNAQKNNLSRTAVLYAHGGYDYGKRQWTYNFTEGREKSIQSWINKNDGKYSLLVLHSCNQNHEEISSRKSAILVPDANYSVIGTFEGAVNLELYIPGIGYIDSYCEEAQFKDLQRLVEKTRITI